MNICCSLRTMCCSRMMADVGNLLLEQYYAACDRLKYAPYLLILYIRHKCRKLKTYMLETFVLLDILERYVNVMSFVENYFVTNNNRMNFR